MEDKIKNAYRDSKDIYDTVLTQGSFFSRLYIRLFWSGTDDNEIARKVLEYIPDDFSGMLLDVPVGTAVFTHQKWKKLSQAEIICLDYSEDMIDKASEHLKRLPNVTCMQGDVGNLPLEEESCDIVLSMNGFHAFPDKARAFREIYRVLKTDGTFLACFYIKGESRITDWLVKAILSRKGWFTPPFHTQTQLRQILEKQYRNIDFHVDGSMVYFKCQK